MLEENQVQEYNSLQQTPGEFFETGAFKNIIQAIRQEVELNESDQSCDHIDDEAENGPFTAIKQLNKMPIKSLGKLISKKFKKQRKSTSKRSDRLSVSQCMSGLGMPQEK